MSNYSKSVCKSAYNSNIEALKERYPDLYERLLDMNQDVLAETVKLKPDDGLPDIVLDNRNRKTLYYGSGDPVEYCREFLASLDLQYAPFLAFMGFGMGYQIITALHDFSKKLDIQHIIIIEKDFEIFRTALMMIDFSEVIRHPHIELFVGIPPEGLFRSLLDYYKRYPEIYFFFKSLKIVIMPSVHQIFGEYYQKAAETLKYSITYVLQQIGNDPYDSILGIERTLSNVMPMIQDPGIIGFKGTFKGKPAILVGAGPSLNKSIGFLKEASQKALIVCVDAALKPLLDAGIKPHVVSTIERTDGTYNFYANLEGLEEIFLVFCPLINPFTYQIYKGPKIIAHRHNEMVEWLGLHTGALSGGPVVGNFAFDIADYFGCDPIIMVGQDLAIPMTGATHVRGMVFGVQEGYRAHTLSVEGNFGEILTTNRYFEESRRSLEIQIERFGGLCVNASEGGAKIKGTLLLDLKSALERHCLHSYDFSEHLKQMWAREKANRNSIKGEVQRVLSVLDQTISKIEGHMKDCKKGLELIEATEKKHDLLIECKPNPAAVKSAEIASKELYEFHDKIISNASLRFLLYTIGGYHTNFAMRKNFVFDQYRDRGFAILKAFLMEKERFTIMGQLLLSTIFVIRNAKSRIEEADGGSALKAQ